MKRVLGVLLLLAGGCGKDAERAPGAAAAAADGMTAEEHARMQAGAGIATERQAVHLSATQARAIGVTFTVVESGPMTRTVRTVGQVVAAMPSDEAFAAGGLEGADASAGEATCE